MHCEDLKMADEKPKKLPWGLKPESLAPSSMKVGVNYYLDYWSNFFMINESAFIC